SFLRLTFFVAIRNPVIGSTLRVPKISTSGAADFQHYSPALVPSHEMAGKIDTIGGGSIRMEGRTNAIGVGFLSITPCQTLRPAFFHLPPELGIVAVATEHFKGYHYARDKRGTGRISRRP